MPENATHPAEDTSAREMIITRLFDAPRELVFDAFTRPEHIVHWWGPDGFTTTIETMDVRPGGVWKHVMHGPDGANYPNEHVYLEVVPPERLVASHGGHKEGGPATRFTHIITFEDQSGKTLVTMRALFDSVETRDRTVRDFNAIEGGHQTLERLADYLPRMAGAELLIERTFDAPRDLVFKAWSEAEQLAQWWGPKGFGLRIVKLDFRPGGIFHYCSTMPNSGSGGGAEIFGIFLYREIVPPERIEFLTAFADKDGNVAPHPMMPSWPRYILNVLTLAEHNGKTKLTIRGIPHEPALAETKAFKEALKFLAPGLQGTFDQLEAYLAKARARA
jgi:uncharacterized protein YndB with AHSA1/START domain